MKFMTGLCVFLFVFSFSAASAERPNILYLYVDDMGWGSIGPNGQQARRAKGLPAVLTPNLDQLAKDGINFTRAYGATVCSPARSSQQTGFHQGHTFGDRNDPDNAKKAIRAEDLTMGDVLSAAGYTTGYWGKWGYGGTKDMANPAIVNTQTLPTSHGYEYVLAELHHVRAHTFFQPTLWSAPTKRKVPGGMIPIPNTLKGVVGSKAYPAQPSNHQHAGYPEKAYCDDSYAFAALDFVRKQSQDYNQSGKPFFALFAAQIPHGPFTEIAKLPEWDAAYKADKHFAGLQKQSQQWAAMVTRIDAHFGNILRALEDPDGDGDTSDSVAKNTLVVFQSDNGGPSGASNSQYDANGGLRGSKGSIHEGGIRVPTVMRWPAKINEASTLKAGSDHDQVIDVSDLLPTFAELAGAEIPVGLDGVSVAPLISGEGTQRTREYLIHEAGDGASIIRGRYKLILRAAGQKNARGKSKAKKGVELYDLGEDHSEKSNIAAKYPELVMELKTLLLGERVMEPAGFANTYHRWAGENGSSTADAANWSNYVYENAGIPYMTDDGAPRDSWIALMENITGQSRTARVKGRLALLGVEIRGKGAKQRVEVFGKQELHGRNEVRVSRNGELSVLSGTVSSLRWLDVQAGGALHGAGTIDADLFLSEGAVMNASFVDQGPSWRVNGKVQVGGLLKLNSLKDFYPATGKTYPVMNAAAIAGRFSSKTATDDRGRKYRIGYTDTSVTVTAE